MAYLTAVPAYGRDYKSKKDVEKDWKDTKDFQLTTMMHSGQYINRQQVPVGTSVQIRYARLQKVCVVK